jgi:Na+/melibiose symporter-like transporter
MKYIPGRKAGSSPAPAREGGWSGFDFVGTILSFAGLGLLIYGLNNGNKHGWLSPLVVGCLALALIIIGVFIAWERRHKDPLLHLDLFLDLRYAFALVATFLAYMLISGNAFLMPFYLEVVKGLNAQAAGMMLLIYSIIYVILSPVSGGFPTGSTRPSCAASP